MSASLASFPLQLIESFSTSMWSYTILLQALDEMLPKATGREARVEKKKIRAEKRKEREYSPGT